MRQREREEREGREERERERKYILKNGKEKNNKRLPQSIKNR